MKARDIMTRRVRTAGPETTVSEIARLLVRHNISAVPIVGRRKQVIGIVSEGDLLRRPETGTARRARWLDFLLDTSSRAREFTKTRGQHAADVMTRGVVSVRPDTDVADVADLMEKRHIKRVPVMQDGRLAGIVSRQDVIAGLAKPSSKRSRTKSRRAASDADIQAALARGLRTNIWTDRAYVNFTVHRGVVELSGFVDDPDRRAALRVLAENTAGVRAVRDNVRVRPLQFYGAE